MTKKILTLLTVSYFASHTSPCSDFSSGCESWITRCVQRETWIRSYYFNSKCSGELPFAGPALFCAPLKWSCNIKQSIHLLWGYCDAFTSIVMLKTHLTLFSKRACIFFFSPPPVLSFETLNILLCLIQPLSLCPSAQKENDGNVCGSVL